MIKNKRSFQYENVDVREAVRKSIDMTQIRILLWVFGVMAVMTAGAGVTILVSADSLVGLVFILSPFLVLACVFAVRMIRLSRHADEYVVCRGHLTDCMKIWNGKTYELRFTAEFMTPEGESVRKKTRYMWFNRSLGYLDEDGGCGKKTILFAYDARRERMLVLGTLQEVLKSAGTGAGK